MTNYFPMNYPIHLKLLLMYFHLQTDHLSWGYRTSQIFFNWLGYKFIIYTFLGGSVGCYWVSKPRSCCSGFSHRLLPFSLVLSYISSHLQIDDPSWGACTIQIMLCKSGDNAHSELSLWWFGYLLFFGGKFM